MLDWFCGSCREESISPLSRGGDEIVEAEWQGSWMLIDPTSQRDGQNIAVERDIVGKPEHPVTAVCNTINRLPDSPYQIIAKQLTRIDSFEEFVRRIKAPIIDLQFSFIPPNIFGVRDALEEELREARRLGADKVEARLKSSSALNAEVPAIQSAIQYASRGGGQFKAITKDREVYRSNENPIEREIVIESDREPLQQILGNASKIMSSDEKGD